MTEASIKKLEDDDFICPGCGNAIDIPEDPEATIAQCDSCRLIACPSCIDLHERDVRPGHERDFQVPVFDWPIAARW